MRLEAVEQMRLPSADVLQMFHVPRTNASVVDV